MITEQKYRKLQKALQLMNESEAELRQDLGESFDSLKAKAEAQVGEYESAQAKGILEQGGGFAEMWTPELRGAMRLERDAAQQEPEEIGTGPIKLGATAVQNAAARPAKADPGGTGAFEKAGKPVEPLQEEQIPKSWVMSTEDIQKHQAELDKIEAEKRDDSLQNASKLKQFDAPPQHMGKDIGFEWWLEPTIDEFRRDMRDVYSDDVDRMTEESDAYKEYSDQRWQNAYEEAKKKDKTLKRVQFSPEVAWPGFAKFLGGASAAAAGVDEAMLFGGISRLTGQRANNLALQQRHPVASGAGFVAGALSPQGLPNLGTRLAGAGLIRAAPKVAQTLQRSRAATGALEGALGAGMAQAGTEGLDVATGELPPDAPGMLRRTGEAMLLGAGAGAGLGALQTGAAGVRRLIRRGELGPNLKDAEAIGAETGALGMRAPESVKELRRRAAAAGKGTTDEAVLQGDIERDIAEYAGGKAAGYREAEEELTGAVSDYGTELGAEYNQAMNKLEKAVASGGNKELQDAISGANRVQEIQYTSPEGITPQPLTPLANAWRKFFSNGRVPQVNWWEDVSGPMEKENAQLRKFAESVWQDIRLVPQKEAKATAGELGGTRVEGAIVATPREARLYGIDVRKRFDEWFERAWAAKDEQITNAAEQGALKGKLSDPTDRDSIREFLWGRFTSKPGSSDGKKWPQLRFVLSPKFLPARDFDQYIANQRRGIVRESSRGGKGEIDIPELHQVVEGGAYGVRDQFPANPKIAGRNVTITRQDGSKQTLKGWSAVQHQVAKGIQMAKDALAYAGLPEGGVPGGRIPAGIEQKLRSQVRTVGTGQNPVQEEAIRRLAQTGEGQVELAATDRLRSEAESLGLKLPVPERPPVNERDVIRGKLTHYSQGEPNEALESMAVQRKLDPSLSRLRTTREELGQLGLSPEGDVAQKGQATAIRALARAYRSGAQPEVVEKALETALAGTGGEARLKVMLGLKALNELKKAEAIGVPFRASSSGQIWASGAPRLAPLQLRVFDPGARRILHTPGSGVGEAASLGTEKRTVEGKLAPEDKKRLRRLRVSLLPATRGPL